MSNTAATDGQAQPAVTLTFLFTDIEGSTRLWEQFPEIMARAQARHGQIIASVVSQRGGNLVLERGEGDSTFSVFPDAVQALAAAVDLQLALRAEPWPLETPLVVRAAIHTGTAAARDESYQSSEVSRCARLRAVAHGGQTILSNATYQLVRDYLPSGSDVRDLGMHGLKDLSRPEHVYQLLHPSLPAEFPPLKSLGALPTNLPAQLTSFIGRTSEVAAVMQLLKRHRLLTITGPGGCGKTRLALQTGVEVLDLFEDGVWLVELAPVTDPNAVPQALADALTIREQAGRAIVDVLDDALTLKKLLLILDNCEHLEEACSALAQRLLSHCTDLRILATSRHALNVAGTGRYSLLPLPVPPEILDSAELSSFESVALFLERAASVVPGFTLTDPAAVAQICRQLSGLPLAIELAAAWVDVLTPRQIADRLSDRFRLLGRRGGEVGPGHHHTLRATLDWSYRCLSAKEKNLFACLSIFKGGWTLEAADSVCSTDGLRVEDVLPLLSRLVEKSLVVVEDTEGQRRFNFLESIREYAREKLEAAHRDEIIAKRHRDWYLSLIEQAEPHLQGAGQAVWLRRLDADRSNIRTALQCCDDESCLKAVTQLYRFWHVRGYMSDGRAWLDALLTKQIPYPDDLRLRALNVAGVLAGAAGDFDKARMYLSKRLELCRTLNDQEGVATTLVNLAIQESELGNYTEARAGYEESIVTWRTINEPKYLAITLSNFGAMAEEQRDYATARLALEEALQLERHLNDSLLTANILLTLASVHRNEGRQASAMDHLVRSFQLRMNIGDKSNFALLLFVLAQLLHDQDRSEHAARLLGASERWNEEFKMSSSPSEILYADAEMHRLAQKLSREKIDVEWRSGRNMRSSEILDYVSQLLGRENHDAETKL